MATVSCPAAHGLLAHTALLVYATHGIYSAQLLVSAIPSSAGSTAVAHLSVSLSQQTGLTNWPPETVASGADVYIFPTSTTT